jgi:hypothetical protein
MPDNEPVSMPAEAGWLAARLPDKRNAKGVLLFTTAGGDIPIEQADQHEYEE